MLIMVTYPDFYASMMRLELKAQNALLGRTAATVMHTMQLFVP